MTAARARKSAASAKPKQVRCAIYTRKSTEEGLDMDFNSLDAQREAAEAYVRSQRHEGWVALPEKYDDGGFTGGNMERPALKRLLADVDAGKVDAVVVYKVDRLSRSLLDFSRIIEVLDRRVCSFVSVTQQFSTANSMGRLTLNVLLSFAQFERELVSERTRDKMSAARRKGKWVGGSLILGYDLDREARKLVVNPAEADQVRQIFTLFLETKSVLETAAELNRRGVPRKTWTGKAGQISGGGLWNKPNLRGLLSNPAYAGKVKYDGQLHAGEHEPILKPQIWERTQALLAPRGNLRTPCVRNKHHALLRGLLRCSCCGRGMVHSFTQKGNVRYRYYVCNTAAKRGYAQCESHSVPAAEIEAFVVNKIGAIGRDPALAAEVATQVRQERACQREALEAERGQIGRNLREGAQRLTQIVGEEGATARLADLQEQMRAAENRLTEIEIELAGLGEGSISEAQVCAALGQFPDLLRSMPLAESCDLIGLLVDRVELDQAKGSVAISFHPAGFDAILEEAA